MSKKLKINQEKNLRFIVRKVMLLRSLKMVENAFIRKGFARKLLARACCDNNK